MQGTAVMVEVVLEQEQEVKTISNGSPKNPWICLRNKAAKRASTGKCIQISILCGNHQAANQNAQRTRPIYSTANIKTKQEKKYFKQVVHFRKIIQKPNNFLPNRTEHSVHLPKAFKLLYLQTPSPEPT